MDEQDNKKQENDEIICGICKTKYIRKDSENHKKSEKHLEAAKKKEEERKKHEDDEIFCEICKTKYIRKNFKNHEQSDEKHTKARERPFFKCSICKEEYDKNEWKQHTKSEIHKIIAQKVEHKGKLKKDQRNNKREQYQSQQIPEGKQDYIDTLTAFCILRCAFKFDNLCRFSINNKEWKQFGDIVIEICTPTGTEIEAICCKKVQSKSNVSVVMSEESGKLSIREQYETIKSLKEKLKSKVSFNLHTLSNFSDTRIIYEGKEIEILQKRGYRRRDILNTTDDTDDICLINIKECEGQEIKFRIFKNQKQVPDLKLLIRCMLENKFDCTRDISDQLMRYIHFFFNPDKIKKIYNAAITNKKKDKTLNFKMSTEDIFLKIAELYLAPYLFLPPDSIVENESHLWNKIIENFDFVVFRNDLDIVKKIYSSIHDILKIETRYNLTEAGRVELTSKEHVKNEILYSAIFENSGFDGSFRFMYLTLWKTGLAPLVLKVQQENQLQLILRVVSFLKTKNIFLKYIILSDLHLDHSFFPENLNAFLNGEDLRLIDDELFHEVLQETRISFLNFTVPLFEIVECNKDFLEKLTPDALLNMIMGDYSFRDVRSDEIMGDTLALHEDYFSRGVVNEERLPSLTYLTRVQGKPAWIQVPPEI